MASSAQFIAQDTLENSIHGPRPMNWATDAINLVPTHSLIITLSTKHIFWLAYTNPRLT